MITKPYVDDEGKFYCISLREGYEEKQESQDKNKGQWLLERLRRAIRAGTSGSLKVIKSMISRLRQIWRILLFDGQGSQLRNRFVISSCVHFSSRNRSNPYL